MESDAVALVGPLIVNEVTVTPSPKSALVRFCWKVVNWPRIVTVTDSP